MTKKPDILFHSEKDQNKGYFQIASGYISETTVLFAQEDIVAVIEAKGRVSFYDRDDRLLAVGEVPPMVSGKEVYEEVCCQTEENVLRILFPRYQWIDNYPHCDGEHDRWDTRRVGQHTLSFDRTDFTVTVE